MYYRPGMLIGVIIFLIVCVIIGIINYGRDAFYDYLIGNKLRKKDEDNWDRAHGKNSYHARTESNGIIKASERDDEELNRLIDNGRYREARQYIKDMIYVAQDVKNRDAIQKYSAYEKELVAKEAAAGSIRTSKQHY